MKRVTIKEVAREAGVSIATVSNALNNADVLHPKTKAHVLNVVERLNYIPNQNGQNLRGKETRAIGLFAPSLRGAFYGVLADSIHMECRKYGYELYIYITTQNATIINNIIGRRVDGAVVLHEGMDETAVDKLEKSHIPVVFLDKEIKAPTISSVVFDSFHEGEMAAKYLLSLGHRNLMHIYGIKNNFDSVKRYEGFLHMLRQAGISFSDANLLSGLFERDAAYREMKRFLREGHALPDAIFASNDLSAIGCIEALRSEGVRVPEDISVIGCDDIEACEFLNPQLTTIRTSFESQGIIATQQLMGMLGEENHGEIKKIEGKLVIRGSCKAREPDMVAAKPDI